MLGEGVVSDGLIVPSEIPGATIDVAGIEAAASDLATAATAVATSGESIVTGWSSLPSVYVAPEAQDLYDVMTPVGTDTEAIETILTSAAATISTLAAEVQDILSKLDTIRADASDFVVEARNGYTVDFWDPNHPNWDNGWFEGLKTDFVDMTSAHIRWDQYDPAVERNQELIALVDAQVIALSEAEATCVDAINALRDDTCLPTSTPLTQQDLDTAGGDRPWGDPDARYRSCYENYNDGIERAATESVVGLAALVGIDTDALGADPAGYLAARAGYDTDTGEWSTDTAADSWQDAADLAFPTIGNAATSLGAIALIGPAVPLLATTTGPVGDAAKAIWQKQQDVILGIVGTPDQWEDNPAEAAGALSFNIASAVVPVAGVAAKTGTLGTVARTALGDATDAARTAITDASHAARHLTDATKSKFDALLHGHRTPSTPHTTPGDTPTTTPTAIGVTTGTVDDLQSHLPGTHPTNGNSNAPDGTVNGNAKPATDSPSGEQTGMDTDTPSGHDPTDTTPPIAPDSGIQTPNDYPSPLRDPDGAVPTDRPIDPATQKPTTDSNGREISDVVSRSDLTVDELNTYLEARDPDAYADYMATGHWPADVQIPKDPKFLGPNGDINWRENVPHDGFVLDRHEKPLKEPYVPFFGEILDRYGPPNGRFTSPVPDSGPYTHEQRSTPFIEDMHQYHQYEVTGDFSRLRDYYEACTDQSVRRRIDGLIRRRIFSWDDLPQSGEIASGFGAVGGGLQYQLPLAVDLLEALNVLREVGR